MMTSRFRASTLALTLAMVAGCGSSDEFQIGDEGADVDETEYEYGQSEEALSAACGGDDSNQLAASLAVAIGKEMGRWEVSSDFQVSNGKLELSPTGTLLCGSNCKNVTALLRLQDDASSVVQNHIPATYRSKLTSWYADQKARLTALVNEQLQKDEGIYQIRFKASGKLLAPAGASTAAGANIQQSDQYWGNNAAQWKVLLKGTLRQIINVKSGLCLDLNGSQAVQRACNGASTQGFRFAQLSAGVLSIRSATNQALEIANSNTANGANLVTGSVEGTAPEQFEFLPNGGGADGVKLLETATAMYSLKFKHSGQALAVSSSSLNDGVSVVQQPYSATDDRFHWYVTVVAQTTWNNAPQLQYQFINRRTGKCLDMANSGSNGTSFVQKTCSTSNTQYFILTPTGGGHQVAFSIHGWPVGVSGGSTSSGAQVVEANVGWQYYNMMTLEPIYAGQPHRLQYSYSSNDGPCGKYDWYNITQPNGMQMANPANTYAQLIFAGGKTTVSGTDPNPYIAQKSNGGQVAIDPNGNMSGGSASSSGSCLVADLLYQNPISKLNACCLKYNGTSGTLKVSSWNPNTLVCQ
jgi:hypothetical protein